VSVERRRGPPEEPGGATRELLRTIVERRPGSCIRELAQALGVRRTAVVHHLRKLSAAGQGRWVRSGRRVLVFPPAATAFEGLVGLLRMGTVSSVVAALRSDPALTVRGLARRLGLTPRAVRYHLLRLRDLGLLEVAWGPSGRRLVLDPRAEAASLEAGREAEAPLVALAHAR